MLAIVSCAVYFHKESEAAVKNFCSNDNPFLVKYSELLGYDSLTVEHFEKILDKNWLNRNSFYFDTHHSLYKMVKSLIL